MNLQLNDLVKMVIDSEHTVKEKKILLNELRKLLAPEQNRWHFRYAIWTLAFIALSIPIIVILSYYAHGKPVEVPSGLLSLGSAAVGALAALLSPSTRKQEEEPPKALPIRSTESPDLLQQNETRVITS